MALPLFPKGGWDVHHHIFERKMPFLTPKLQASLTIWICKAERFPYAPDRHLTPPSATVERYNAFKKELGLTNSVLTHGLSYGADCACLTTFISELGESTTRGIAVIDPETVTSDQLEKMHDDGIRGIRVNLYRYNAMHDVELQKTALRRHAQVLKGQFPSWSMAFTHLHPEFWAELKPVITQEIASLGGHLVTDHFGLFKGASLLPPELHGDVFLQDGFQEMVDLVRDGTLFIKISAPYRVSKEAPWFNDLKPLVRAFMDANPKQVVWGSDWYVILLSFLSMKFIVNIDQASYAPDEGQISR